MAYNQIITAIDAELAKLQSARQLLVNTPDALVTPPASKRGRPVGSKNIGEIAPSTPKKSTMSAEGRAKIAEAQRKRHAAKKKAERKAAKEVANQQTDAIEGASAVI